MSNIDIRKYIISNFKNDSKENVKKAVEEAIKNKDEDALLGLGVLFELLWSKLDDNLKSKTIGIIIETIKEDK